MRKVLLLSTFVLATALGLPVMAGETVLGIARTKAKVEDQRLDESYKIFLNHMFSDNFGLDIGHGNYGEFNGNYYDVNYDAKFVSTNIAFLAAVPVNDYFSLYGKVGVSEWKIKVGVDGYDSDTENGTDPMGGVGFDIRIGKAGLIKLEYEAIETNEGDAESTNIGVAFRF